MDTSHSTAQHSAAFFFRFLFSVSSSVRQLLHLWHSYSKDQPTATATVDRGRGKGAGQFMDCSGLCKLV